jgi:hypothetical protein
MDELKTRFLRMKNAQRPRKALENIDEYVKFVCVSAPWSAKERKKNRGEEEANGVCRQ